MHPIAPAGQVTLDQPQQARDALLRRRSVRNVLTRERLLLDLRAHVSWVDGVDAESGMLGAQNRRDLLESGLRRAVSTPALVRLEGRVGDDVEYPRPGGKCGSESWTSASGANTFTSYTLRSSLTGIGPKEAAGSGRARWRC